jgi:hypothetical protein
LTATGVEAKETTEYADMRQTTQKMHSQTRESLRKVSFYQKRSYEHRMHEDCYEVDDLVWLFSHMKKMKVSPKLQQFLEEPTKITKKIISLLYQVKKDLLNMRNSRNDNNVKI